MGKIADALKANLRELASSDARSLREIDHELRNASQPANANKLLYSPDKLKQLVGKGSFKKQTVATLKKICREHKITGYSKLKKNELCIELEKNNIEPPPPPLESFSKKELISLIKQIIDY